MKKKQTRRVTNQETRDNTSSCSEDERMKSVTRSSTRKKKISSSSSRTSVTSSSMADSAYEADDSARSDTSPPKQQAVDEYRMEAIEDVPVVAKTRKRKNVPQNKQSNKTKKVKKTKTNLNMSTSTPVFEGIKSRDTADCILVTPEVTPILAENDHNKKRDIIQSKDLSTPTMRRSLRKRSFSFQDPELSAISTQLSFDSQADSGIVISPPLKKIKSTKSAAYGSQQQSSKYSTILSKKPVSSDICTTQKREKSENSFVPRVCENYSVKGKSVLKESALNSSCFGFDSIQTPSPVCRPKKSRKGAATKKVLKEPKTAYRSPIKNSSDSLFDDSPSRGQSDSSSVNTDSQENIGVSHGSPSLFSDDLFSDVGDQPAVNKTSAKSYSCNKLKPKIKKSKPKESKLDAWANSFNTELNSIENFDLHIE